MRVKAELSFPGKLKDEPLICWVSKKFDITLSILEASFTTEIGWAILIFEGKVEEINKALAYLKNKGVEISIQEGVEIDIRQQDIPDV
jgi:ABC-type methionine transport system ATPase subunit